MGMPWQSSTRLTSAGVRNRSGWTTLSAPALRSHLLTAPTEVLESITVTTVKTLELNAQVPLAQPCLLLKNVTFGEVLVEVLSFFLNLSNTMPLFNCLLSRDSQIDQRD